MTSEEQAAQRALQDASTQIDDLRASLASLKVDLDQERQHITDMLAHVRAAIDAETAKPTTEPESSAWRKLSALIRP
jgi:septal ring factor EnvC (AmiA/AmiB activator)